MKQSLSLTESCFRTITNHNNVLCVFILFCWYTIFNISVNLNQDSGSSILHGHGCCIEVIKKPRLNGAQR